MHSIYAIRGGVLKGKSVHISHVLIPLEVSMLGDGMVDERRIWSTEQERVAAFRNW